MRNDHLLKKPIQILKELRWIILLLAIIALILVLLYPSPNQESQSPPNTDVAETETTSSTKHQNYVLGHKEYVLEIADNADEHKKGLSGRTQLPAGQGMLFVFQASGDHGIWMKDMRFAIDIIWLDANQQIVGLKANARPESYPETFYSEDASLYVIEVNVGEIAETGLKIGDQLHLVNGN